MDRHSIISFFFFLNTNHSLIMPQKLKKKISDGDSDLDESSESTLPPLAGLSLLDASFSLENKFKKSFFFQHLRILLRLLVALVQKRLTSMG